MTPSMRRAYVTKILPRDHRAHGDATVVNETNVAAAK